MNSIPFLCEVHARKDKLPTKVDDSFIHSFLGLFFPLHIIRTENEQSHEEDQGRNKQEDSPDKRYNQCQSHRLAGHSRLDGQVRIEQIRHMGSSVPKESEGKLQHDEEKGDPVPFSLYDECQSDQKAAERYHEHPADSKHAIKMLGIVIAQCKESQKAHENGWQAVVERKATQ